MAVLLRHVLPFSAGHWQRCWWPAWLGRVLFLGFLIVTFNGRALAQPDEEPREEGIIVRRVRFERVPIFDQADLDKVPWLPLSLANRLHVTTRQRVIDRELLFAQGKVLDPEHLQESERKLRGLGIFSEVEVVAVPAPGDSVDVVVRTRELWTTSIDIGYERFADEILWSVDVRERNAFGTAKGFQAQRSQDLDRSSWTFGLSDPQLFDGTWNGSALWRNADDGNSIVTRIARPFFSLQDERAGSVFFADREASPRYYVDDGEYVRPGGDFRDLGVEGQRLLDVSPHRVWRGGVGFRLQTQDLHADRPLVIETAKGELDQVFEFPDSPDEDHSWRTVYLGIERRSRVYEELRYISGMGVVEDLAMGPELDFDLGWTSRALGSTASGLWVSLRHSWNGWLTKNWLQQLNLGVDGLINSRGGQDLRFRARLRGYRQIATGITFASSLRFAGASRIDRHQVFSLGLESGLRAARFREFNGDRLVGANVELRTVYTPRLFDLVTPGLTVFADTGAAWFEESRDFRPELLRGAFGFGLRLGFSRTSEDLPVRVDLAWPMLYDSDRSSPVISVGTGQIF